MALLISSQGGPLFTNLPPYVFILNTVTDKWFNNRTGSIVVLEIFHRLCLGSLDELVTLHELTNLDYWTGPIKDEP